MSFTEQEYLVLSIGYEIEKRKQVLIRASFE